MGLVAAKERYQAQLRSIAEDMKCRSIYLAALLVSLIDIAATATAERHLIRDFDCR
jgi:hypothetical protein